MKIVLANCVGVDSEGWNIIPYPSRWTTSAKSHSGAFTYYPRDLGYLSSLLKRDTPHSVRLVDACLNRMNKEDYAKRIIDEKPDWLVIESSSRTYDEDVWVGARVREATGGRVMLVGQHPSAFPKEAASDGDMVIRGEYLAPALEFFGNGRKAPEGSIMEFDKSGLIGVDRLPYPEDDDVSRYDYALKGDPICEYREIQMYTARGCPYNCVFCVASHAYYGGPDWRPRNPRAVVAEMRALFERYPGCEGMFFDDEIFNANIARVKSFARAIIGAGLDGKRYNAMCAYHNMTRETLELMKEAGFYLARVGIETASGEVASAMNLKGKHRPDKLLHVLETAKEVGVKIYGTFTLGGPGSSEAEDGKTITLMKRLLEEDLISDCQVSICTPLPGSEYYEIAQNEGLLAGKSWRDFDGGVASVVDLPGYPASRIIETRAAALHAYDEARSKRDGRLFDRAWEQGRATLRQEPGRILIFRSSRDWHLGLCLRGIRRLWPSAQVAMLCHSSHMGRYAGEYPWLRLIEYPVDGFLDKRSLGERARAAIWELRPDVSFIPSNVYHCRGYSNVVEIAQAAGPGEVYFINSAGGLVQADKGRNRVG